MAEEIREQETVLSPTDQAQQNPRDVALFSAGATRPRVLAIGLTPDEIEAIRPVAGSIVEASSIYDVHAEEHDVLIHTGANFSDSSWFMNRRIAFAAAAKPPEERPRVAPSSGGVHGSGRTPTASRTQFKPARDFDVTEKARSLGVASLVERSCRPAQGATYSGFTTPVYPDREETPFLRERLTNGMCLAALLETVDDPTRSDSAFWLPDIARAFLADWVRVAFAHWRAHDPDAFPEGAEWRTSDAWSAPVELDARARLVAFDEAEAERVAKAAARRRQLTDGLDASLSAGEVWRSLVSDAGDELVAAVKTALEGFGFAVVDADALPQHKGKKREDLRVSDGDWVALVEVKGYAGAAKSNDLQQLAAAAAAYAATGGRVPDALWYIVNGFRNENPAQRPRALDNRDDDLAGFAENHGGGLIDTRDLFILRQSVALGDMSHEDARAVLKATTGRFSTKQEA
ncbi:hypothetical protein [Microbacterium azadirachtae]|uniref:hypothetical protein n=1 Tax=Microbacterium azadirachtae TaxID=582680 RepID=UPI000881CD26|nr:hypothetical protein [Microbacterium azadirachtae]SDL21913.1 hypothetical protein SAMN04488593_0344 [Microbacterium azadirachtae]SEF51893.1 hypothetical protein SAMN04488594_0334 [Microbacterium azadirachtae]SEF51996.1 hypothetical protein SAMN04488592_0343 [Microbacterium azadirachtae]